MTDVLCVCIFSSPQNTVTSRNTALDLQQVTLQEAFCCRVWETLRLAGMSWRRASPLPGLQSCTRQKEVPQSSFTSVLKHNSSSRNICYHLLELTFTGIHSGNQGFDLAPWFLTGKVWTIYGPCLKHSGNRCSQVLKNKPKKPPNHIIFS